MERAALVTNHVIKLSEVGSRKVIILYNLSSAYRWNIPQSKNISFIEGDILDDEMLKRLKKKPRYVFHLALILVIKNNENLILK